MHVLISAAFAVLLQAPRVPISPLHAAIMVERAAAPHAATGRVCPCLNARRP